MNVLCKYWIRQLRTQHNAYWVDIRFTQVRGRDGWSVSARTGRGTYELGRSPSLIIALWRAKKMPV